MPCDLRAYHIPIDSLQRLPPELISPIYDLVFRADLCCLAHSLNILRTSKSYYTSNIQRLYETVVLNDHNCKAFLGCWTDPREYDEKGIEVEVGSWNLATISSQIFPSDVEGPSPLVDNIPLSFHPASRRILLWRHCRTLHMDSVRAVRMAALADERLQGLPQPAVLNLYKPLEYPYPYPCLFPSLKRISLALPITQKLYNDPEPRTAAKYFDLSAQGGEEEPPVGDDFNTLLIPLRKGTVVCMCVPDMTSGSEVTVYNYLRRGRWEPYTRRDLFFRHIDHCCEDQLDWPPSLVLHDVDLAYLKRYYFNVDSLRLDLKSQGGWKTAHNSEFEMERMRQVKEWCRSFFDWLVVKNLLPNYNKKNIFFPTHIHISNITSHSMAFSRLHDQQELNERSVVVGAGGDGVYEEFQSFLDEQPGYLPWARDLGGMLSLGPSMDCDICDYSHGD